MALTINTNIASINAQRNLATTQSALQTSLARLSSGLRINSAKDDAAGLAISQRLQAQVRGLNQAVRNANDGTSLAQTAEGALGSMGDMLQRVRELAVESANATNSASDRANINTEVQQLTQEIDRVAKTTSFNNVNLLDGSFLNEQFQVGSNANQTIGFSIGNFQAAYFGGYGKNSDGKSILAVAAATALPTNNNIAAQSLTVTGSDGTSAISKSLTITLGESAKAIADQVNASGTNVSATAVTTAYIDTLSAAGATTMTIYGAPDSTGARLGVGITSATGTLSDIADQINKTTSQTGITATYDSTSSKITMTQSQGYDIGIANYNNGTATVKFYGEDTSTKQTLTSTADDSGTDSSIVGGKLSFNSSYAFSLKSDTANSGIITGANSVVVSGALSSVAGMKVDTVANANATITAVDGALGALNGMRATLGAVQNRFTAAISNLQSMSQNLSSAESEIVDTDFAAETSAFTRNQILSQSGTAMVAQANTVPQGAITLIQKLG